jgi:hypothetical protein
MSDENPFELYDLDPREGIGAITQRLKELAEDAKTDEERERIRAAWEELTLHPARRQRAALHAHPETRTALGMPPSFPRRKMPPAAAESTPTAAQALDVELGDLAARPSLLAMLGVVTAESKDEGNTRSSDVKSSTDALDRDPIL